MQSLVATCRLEDSTHASIMIIFHAHANGGRGEFSRGNAARVSGLRSDGQPGSYPTSDPQPVPTYRLPTICPDGLMDSSVGLPAYSSGHRDGAEKIKSSVGLGVRRRHMALIVFFRGINVGGYRTFRPSMLARELCAYDVVNVGAAGTLVVRKPGPRAKFLAELRRKLPFKAEVAFCDGSDLVRLEMEDPFGSESSRPDL
jgi:hypothetical protein